MAVSKGCPNGLVASFILSSPIGKLKMTCCSGAIHSLGMLSSLSEEPFHPDPSINVVITNRLDHEDLGNCDAVAIKCIQWLQTYFHRPLRDIRDTQLPPICHLQKPFDSFRMRVWQTLAEKVTFGQVVTYSELASMSGSSSKASRAVGQAMRNNPVMILVPCHRVILSNGCIGNYSGGKWNDVKGWLLEYETHTKNGITTLK